MAVEALTNQGSFGAKDIEAPWNSNGSKIVLELGTIEWPLIFEALLRGH